MGRPGERRTRLRQSRRQRIGERRAPSRTGRRAEEKPPRQLQKARPLNDTRPGHTRTTRDATLFTLKILIRYTGLSMCTILYTCSNTCCNHGTYSRGSLALTKRSYYALQQSLNSIFSPPLLKLEVYQTDVPVHLVVCLHVYIILRGIKNVTLLEVIIMKQC